MYRQPVTNHIIQTGIVDAPPIALIHKGEDCVFFSFRSKHRCLSEDNWKDSYTTTHLVMATGEQVRAYASKVGKGNRVKVTGYLAYQNLDGTGEKTPIIMAQKIVFLKDYGT
jgi:single-stranded DNA-binding protein